MGSKFKTWYMNIGNIFEYEKAYECYNLSEIHKKKIRKNFDLSDFLYFGY